VTTHEAAEAARLRLRHAEAVGAASVRTRRARSARGYLVLGLATVAILAALFPLVDIIALVTVHGIAAMKLSLFTTVTSGVAGGLQNAILGTLVLVAGGMIIAGPLGVFTGIYLAEWAEPRVAAVLRYLSDVLVGVPSIVIGYFGFAVFVTGLGWGFSLAAGAIALATFMLPYIVRTTELALTKVPGELREGSLALGITRGRTIHSVSLPVAAPGILTGLLLALGIGLGETAPLIYTASWSNYDPHLVPTHSPVGYLTYVVWTFINQPFSASHELAYAAALLLLIGVLVLNLVARQLLVGRQAD